jgi:PrtD family type I secretion system ABC transporter
MQSMVLGIGAYLVIIGEATAGIMIASSILLSRALAPVELAIAHWKNFVASRQAHGRLKDLMTKMPEEEDPLALPTPEGALAVEGVSAAPPGTQRIVLRDVQFGLKGGDGLGIIGPSASGKSTLARLIVGAWQPIRGKVRLDGAALDQWSPVALGQHVGYLPQAVELFDGTVAENIARFEPEPDPGLVIAGARAAGVHDLIVNLPEGYDTRIGEAGANLSAGQRQRVALARALYRDPFLIVLDEPNSNLDSEGEQALTAAIRGVRERGGIAVVIAHRPSALNAIDQILVLNQGRQQAFGPRDEVLKPPPQPVRQGAVPLSVISGAVPAATS